MGSNAAGPPSTWQVGAHWEINWTIEEGLYGRTAPWGKGRVWGSWLGLLVGRCI